MRYDPQTQPLRSWVMYHRKWLYQLLLFSPTACAINVFVLWKTFSPSPVVALVGLLSALATVAFYIAIVWVEGGDASTRRKIQKCIGALPTIFFANIIMILATGAVIGLILRVTGRWM